MSATLLISPSRDPVITPVPGKPHMWVASIDKAVFNATAVPRRMHQVGDSARSAAGGYVLQLQEGWGFHDSATLLVRSQRQRAIDVA